jgi:hypothetical protein
MVLGLLFLTLGIDVGWLAFVRSQGQTAVDAAALRGAAALPNYNNTKGDSTKVIAMVTEINSDNAVMNEGAGLTNTDVDFCTGTPDSPTCPSSDIPASGVKVTKTYAAPLFFSRILNGGKSSTNITVSSIAWLGRAECGPNCFPVGLCKDQVKYPASCSKSDEWDGVANQSPSTTDDSAWWTPVDVSTNAKACKDMVNDPRKVPNIKVGDLVDRSNGQIGSCLEDVETRFIDTSDCSAAKCAAKHPACTVVLPVFDCIGSPTHPAPVEGFVSLCISDVQSKSKPKFVQGTMICDVTPSGSGGGGPFLGTYGERPTLVK